MHIPNLHEYAQRIAKRKEYAYKNAKRYRIEGVDESEKIRKDFWNTINSNKVSDNILSDSDVEVVDVDGKDVVYIHVPMADWHVKPVYLNENVYKNTFKRNHEGNFHCTEQQVRAMIRDSAPPQIVLR